VDRTFQQKSFIEFSRIILGFVVSKEGKLLNLKNIVGIINMLTPKNPMAFKFLMG
jgi:hypothetical protein